MRPRLVAGGNVTPVRSRSCSRTGCSARATSTLTYAYADSTAVLGPLGLRAEPGTYDLCATHSSSLSVPRGWDVIRLPAAETDAGPSSDDLLALALRRLGQLFPRQPCIGFGQIGQTFTHHAHSI